MAEPMPASAPASGGVRDGLGDLSRDPRLVCAQGQETRSMNSRLVYRVAAASLFAALVLTACGQKGPLYMPDKGGEVVTRPGGATQSTPQQTPQPSTETAPQPSTTTPESTTTKPDEKKNPPR